MKVESTQKGKKEEMRFENVIDGLLTVEWERIERRSGWREKVSTEKSGRLRLT